MKQVYATANTIISPLGITTSAHIEQIKKGISGIQQINDSHISPTPFYGSKLRPDQLNTISRKITKPESFTKLEQMLIFAIQAILEQSNRSVGPKTGLVIATTKGNIDVLASTSKFSKQRAYLPELAKQIKNYFGFIPQPVIVSHACVSGVMAIAVAKRMIEQGVYESAIVVAGDVMSRFTVSGFQSFQALSSSPCKPYSKFRTGLSLGEASAALWVTPEKPSQNAVALLGEGSNNDANHISGPSRTGEGLYLSINAALKESQLTAKDIDFISSHGTATLYNDEMESIAFYRSGLLNTPISSFKGYLGHTLGASGLVEAIIGIQALQNNMLLPTKGMDVLGVSKPINVVTTYTEKPIYTFLKTASGFGGTNTALVFKKLKNT